MPTDFFIASSAVIPLLAVALLLQTRGSVAASDLGSRFSRRRFHPHLPSFTLGLRLGAGTNALLLGVISGWAEFVCLRSLETHTAVSGGTTVVWLALGLLSASLVGSAVADAARSVEVAKEDAQQPPP